MGLIVDFQGLWNIKKSLYLYYDGFYLFIPRNRNGTPTNRRYENEAIMSVPDHFAFRSGIFKTIEKIHELGIFF
jgi:hypothetical protein